MRQLQVRDDRLTGNVVFFIVVNVISDMFRPRHEGKNDRYLLVKRDVSFNPIKQVSIEEVLPLKIGAFFFIARCHNLDRIKLERFPRS